jgi:uncharacterized radical SAM superfamily Fe-S cluster-containing enzyme
MQLKDEIIKNINNMDIDELMYMKTVIRNINKKNKGKSINNTGGAEMARIREILKNKNLSNEIDLLRKDRI